MDSEYYRRQGYMDASSALLDEIRSIHRQLKNSKLSLKRRRTLTKLFNSYLSAGLFLNSDYQSRYGEWKND